MKKIALLLMVIATWAISESQSQAQVGYVAYYQPAPVYSPPSCYAPAPAYYSSYYAPAVVAPVYQPVTRVRTRYRPILGGTVTRVRHSYYAPPVVYGY